MQLCNIHYYFRGSGPAVLIIMLFGAMHTEVRAAMGAAPSVLSLSGKPGEKVEGIIEIKESGEHHGLFKIYPGDWERTDDGETRFLPPGSLPRSCASWASSVPDTILVKPGKVENLKVSFYIPEGSHGLYWSILFVEANRQAVPGQAHGIYVTERLGIKIYINVGDSGRPQWNLAFMENLRETESFKGFNVRARLDNKGETDLDCKVWAEAGNLDDSKRIASGPVTCKVLPGYGRNLMLHFKEGLSPGGYDVEVIGDCGKLSQTIRSRINIRSGDMP